MLPKHWHVIDDQCQLRWSEVVGGALDVRIIAVMRLRCFPEGTKISPQVAPLRRILVLFRVASFKLQVLASEDVGFSRTLPLDIKQF